MKTRFLKMIVPAFVLLLAVTAAFSFKQADQLTVAETGWINLPGDPCAVEVECDTKPGPVCTAFYEGVEHQAYGKVDPDIMSCTKVLRKP